MSSSLPPGVTEDMIPGNRPEDVKWERVYEAVELELGIRKVRFDADVVANLSDEISYDWDGVSELHHEVSTAVDNWIEDGENEDSN